LTFMAFSLGAEAGIPRRTWRTPERRLLFDRDGRSPAFRRSTVLGISTLSALRVRANKRAGARPAPKFAVASRGLAAAADAGVGRLRRANVKAGIGRVGWRSFAVLDVLEEVHRLVSHFERPLADLSGGQALLHQFDLDRQRVGDNERERPGSDLV